MLKCRVKSIQAHLPFVHIIYDSMSSQPLSCQGRRLQISLILTVLTL